jgi:outer membrane protein assembly factor BamD
LVIDVLLSRLAALFLMLFALSACSIFDADEKPIDPANVPVDQLYSQGVDQLNAKQYDVAVRTFTSLEQTYPYSAYAIKAQMMQGYGEYLRNHYADSIAVLDRFIQLHPVHRDIAYVYYLRALAYYEQIADIARDQKGTADAMGALQEVTTRFPDSPYARDARLKIDLARDHLAGKEMEIGRYYERQHLYTAAIGRFQRVVDNYQTTNHVPEALQRLTEIYLLLGLPEEARKTAAVLGHNYPGSEWYKSSYEQMVSAGEVEAAPTLQKAAPVQEQGFFSHLVPDIF